MENNYRISFKGKSFLVTIDDFESIFSNEKISSVSSFGDYSEYYEENDINTEKSWWTTNLTDLLKTELSVKIEYLRIDLK